MNNYTTANAVLSIFCKNYMELKKGLPIRPSEMGVLNIIAEIPGPHTPVMVAELLGVSKPMMTAHVTSLVNKGYIEKEPSLEDKRAYYIHLTQKGMELVESAKLDLNEQLNHLETCLGQENFNTLIMLTQEANKILDANHMESNY